MSEPQPVSCFVRSGKLNPIRVHLEHVVGASLKYQVDKYHSFEQPQLLSNFDSLDCFFHSRDLASGPIFIVSDNDVVTADPTALREAIQVMNGNPQLGILGFAYKPNLRIIDLGDYFHSAVHVVIRSEGDGPDYWEVDHTGTLVVIRGEAMPDSAEDMEQPDFNNGRGDDRLLCYAIRERGYKVGILPHHHTIHLGEQLSTLWPEGNRAYAASS